MENIESTTKINDGKERLMSLLNSVGYYGELSVDALLSVMPGGKLSYNNGHFTFEYEMRAVIIHANTAIEALVRAYYVAN